MSRRWLPLPTALLALVGYSAARLVGFQPPFAFAMSLLAVAGFAAGLLASRR